MTSAFDPNLVFLLYDNTLPGDTLTNDTTGGGNGNDTTTGNDTATGNQIPQVTDTLGASLAGTGAADIIRGNIGNDSLYGRGGNDTIFGDDGEDLIDGETGNDYINGNQNRDSILGSEGDDTLLGGKGSDTLYGGNGQDFVSGNNDNDVLIAGSDSIGIDDNNNNTLYGGAGDDCIFGGNRDDLLSGDRGQDILVGAEGQDGFLISVNSGSANQAFVDVILDYNENDDFFFLPSDLTYSQLVIETGSIDSVSGLLIRTDDANNPTYLAFIPGFTRNLTSGDFKSLT